MASQLSTSGKFQAKWETVSKHKQKEKKIIQGGHHPKNGISVDLCPLCVCPYAFMCICMKMPMFLLSPSLSLSLPSLSFPTLPINFIMPLFLLGHETYVNLPSKGCFCLPGLLGEDTEDEEGSYGQIMTDTLRWWQRNTNAASHCASGSFRCCVITQIQNYVCSIICESLQQLKL